MFFFLFLVAELLPGQRPILQELLRLPRVPVKPQPSAPRTRGGVQNTTNGNRAGGEGEGGGGKKNTHKKNKGVGGKKEKTTKKKKNL